MIVPWRNYSDVLKNFLQMCFKASQRSFICPQILFEVFKVPLYGNCEPALEDGLFMIRIQVDKSCVSNFSQVEKRTPI